MRVQARWALLLMLGLCACGRHDRSAVRFYAAASLKETTEDLVEAWAARDRSKLVPVLASSPTLAEEIREGAAADIFLPDSPQWMDYLVRESKRVRSDSRVDLLSNRLVLVVPPGNKAGIESPADLDSRKLRRLAVGDPEQVPAGIYAAAWLKSTGLWDRVRRKLRPAGDVRAALALVERGDANAGIVYLTDAMVGDVEVVAVLDSELAPPIRYPIALLDRPDGEQPSPRALACYQWLLGEEAAAIFRRHGFLTLTGSP